MELSCYRVVMAGRAPIICAASAGAAQARAELIFPGREVRVVAYLHPFHPWAGKHPAANLMVRLHLDAPSLPRSLLDRLLNG